MCCLLQATDHPVSDSDSWGAAGQTHNHCCKWNVYSHFSQHHRCVGFFFFFYNITNGRPKTNFKFVNNKSLLISFDFHWFATEDLCNSAAIGCLQGNQLNGFGRFKCVLDWFLSTSERKYLKTCCIISNSQTADSTSETITVMLFL